MGLGIGLGIGMDRSARRELVAPTITSATTANNGENATLAHALTANETVTWSIAGGADQARFEISGSTLRWAANGTKDFEAPNDANTDNAYVVNVRATDLLGNTSDQTITITVTNVLEVTLAALSLDDLTIAEDQPTGTKVGTITGATAGSTVTLHAQSNANMFAKDGNDIEVGATPLDFETVPSPTVTLRETHADASNSPRDSVIGIEVTDVAEGYAAWPALIGAEMVVNGDCSSGTGWTLGTGVTIAAGKMQAVSATTTATNSGTSEEALIADVTYRCAFTIDTFTGGAAQLTCGDAVGTSRASAATFSQDLTPTVPDGGWQIVFTSATMQLDTFSVKSVGAMGVEADWDLSDGGGVIYWSAGTLEIDTGNADSGDTASLTGSALTAFDAAVSNSTACTVTFTISYQDDPGLFEFRMKGGSWVEVDADGTSPIIVACTSGAGSGFEIRGKAGEVGLINIQRIQITLA